MFDLVIYYLSNVRHIEQRHVCNIVVESKNAGHNRISRIMQTGLWLSQVDDVGASYDEYIPPHHIAGAVLQKQGVCVEVE